LSSVGRKFALGVDGGGTKTVAVVVDSAGRELGWGRAGPSNRHTVGEPSAAANLASAIGEALAQAGIPRVGAVCLGMDEFDPATSYTAPRFHQADDPRQWINGPTLQIDTVIRVEE